MDLDNYTIQDDGSDFLTIGAVLTQTRLYDLVRTPRDDHDGSCLPLITYYTTCRVRDCLRLLQVVELLTGCLPVVSRQARIDACAHT